MCASSVNRIVCRDTRWTTSVGADDSARARLLTIPSAGRPRAVWKRRTACSVTAPNRPSIGPGAKPAAASRRCSFRTSSAGSWPRRPGDNTIDRVSPHVWWPTIPSTANPRDAWNRMTALIVSGPYRPSIGPGESPASTRRRWSTRTAAEPSGVLSRSQALGSRGQTGRRSIGHGRRPALSRWLRAPALAGARMPGGAARAHSPKAPEIDGVPDGFPRGRLRRASRRGDPLHPCRRERGHRPRGSASRRARRLQRLGSPPIRLAL